MRKEKGLFITFEGIDGSGKSTQVVTLQRVLERRGYEVMLIREPGGTTIGEKIRSILLDRANDQMTPETELLLYEAARAQIVQEVIAPQLLLGKAVICDRFFDSTVAYQGYARGLSLDSIDFLNRLATGGVEPDITFLLDLPAEEAWKRRHGRSLGEDRLEAEGMEFMRRVRAGYLSLATNHPRVHVLDAMLTAEELTEYIHCKVWEVIDT